MKKLLACAVLASLLVLDVLPASAEETPPPPPPNSVTNWQGLRFGVGLSVTFDNGSDRRVSDAIVDANGLVRVTDEENSVTRVMLESHYFFPCDLRYLWRTEDERMSLNKFFTEDCGIGPFVAIQPGEDDIIDAASLGLMIGFKYPYSDLVSDRSSFNLGVGLVVDPNGQILGDGIEENEALPGAETEVRFKEKQQYGWLLVASFSF